MSKEQERADARPEETTAETAQAAEEQPRPEHEVRYDSLVKYPESQTQPSRYAPPTDDEINRKLDLTAPEPGVYLLRDKAGKVLYVGKAKSLRSRVRAYFRDGGDTRFQVRFLMSKVRDF